MFGFREGHIEIIELLLRENGIIWDNVSKNGRTPLHTVGNIFTYKHLHEFLYRWSLKCNIN